MQRFYPRSSDLVFAPSFSLCIFCGEKDESFTEDGLDLHYWRHCPMLHRCHECGQVDGSAHLTLTERRWRMQLCSVPQVVEISGLSRHLLDECESRSRFRRCPRCCQALPAEDLNRHLQGSSCRCESCSWRAGLSRLLSDGTRVWNGSVVCRQIYRLDTDLIPLCLLIISNLTVKHPNPAAFQ